MNYLITWPFLKPCRYKSKWHWSTIQIIITVQYDKVVIRSIAWQMCHYSPWESNSPLLFTNDFIKSTRNGPSSIPFMSYVNLFITNLDQSLYYSYKFSKCYIIKWTNWMTPSLSFSNKSALKSLIIAQTCLIKLWIS